MTAVRPALVRLLVGAIALAVGVTGTFTVAARISQLDSGLDSARALLWEARRVAAETERLRIQVAEMEGARGSPGASPYAPGEMDPYRFGETVRDLAGSRGLRVERFQPVRSGQEDLVELTVRGSAAAFVEFLYAAAEQGRRWTLPHISIQGTREEVIALMRLGYETTTTTAP